MVKTLTFDLHFTELEIRPLTAAGRAFVKEYGPAHLLKVKYNIAIDAGLHVRFENAAARDAVASIKSS